MNIEKYTVGTGDRFTHQGGVQLRALVLARDTGLRVSPAWCKSNREHIFIDNQPDELCVGADAAIAALGRKDVYYLNADHIGLQSVDRFLAASDFYTVDLVDFTCLPAGLKLSVHSGSDKFSLYPIINGLLKKHGCGLHVKTAGTTWLEEVIGLAEAGGEGLPLAREIYAGAHARFDELTGPYATVIDVAKDRLPSPEAVAGWSGEEYVGRLRHDRGNPAYNPDFRQLIHVGFKVAAKLGGRYTAALKTDEAIIARHVTPISSTATSSPSLADSDRFTFYL